VKISLESGQKVLFSVIWYICKPQRGKNIMAENNEVNIEIRDGVVKCNGFAYFKEEKNGMISWYLPGFDMFFSSKTFDEGMVTAKAMSKSFILYWLEKERNFNGLILAITKLGFKAIDHRNTVNQMLRGKKHKATFESKGAIRGEFVGAKNTKLELEVA
jgi:hypothetical protein